MTWTVFIVVLFAASLHASWNTMVKRAGYGGARSTTVLVTAGASAVAAIVLPFLRLPSQASWLFLAASTVLQVVYFELVARAYRVADMSLAYPLMRGGAPLIVAVVGQAALNEPLHPLAWLGVAALSAGVLLMAFDQGAGVARGQTRLAAGVGVALANAAVIAAYTMVDGIGVRRSGSPAAYTLWLFLLTGLVFIGWSLATRRGAFLAGLRQGWRVGLAGGAFATASYGLALWAMTRAPVAEIAALRETSILFGVAISVLLLKERTGAARLAAAGLIAAGAAVLRLA